MTFRSFFKSRKPKSTPTDVSDQHVGKVIRASGLDPDESEQVALSPDLYSKVRSRIAVTRMESEASGYWLETLFVFKRAATVVTVLVVLIGVAVVYLKRGRPGAPPDGAAQAVFTRVSDRADPVTACSISAKNECAISRGEVLATIVPQGEEEFQR